jgi:hypothetical protein
MKTQSSSSYRSSQPGMAPWAEEPVRDIFVFFLVNHLITKLMMHDRPNQAAPYHIAYSEIRLQLFSAFLYEVNWVPCFCCRVFPVHKHLTSQRYMKTGGKAPRSNDFGTERRRVGRFISTARTPIVHWAEGLAGPRICLVAVVTWNIIGRNKPQQNM